MTGRILIVDDSALSRRTLRRILESAGHQVIEAVDGTSALESYFLERPDLVLLDLTMHGMHGIEVLEKLRELQPDASVIVASADIQRSTQGMAQAAGASGYVTKPFTPEQVLDAVSAALAGAGDATH